MKKSFLVVAALLVSALGIASASTPGLNPTVTDLSLLTAPTVPDAPQATVHYVVKMRYRMSNSDTWNAISYNGDTIHVVIKLPDGQEINSMLPEDGGQFSMSSDNTCSIFAGEKTLPFADPGDRAATAMVYYSPNLDPNYSYSAGSNAYFRKVDNDYFIEFAVDLVIQSRVFE